MSSTWGTKIKLSIFGESHGAAVGAVLDGLPAGEPVCWEDILAQMARRAPGKDKSATPRKEADLPKVLSGMLEGKTTGAPLCAIIENTNTRSADYGNLAAVPRPGHSDYPAYVLYKGCNDVRGGGHFSGRLTAAIVFAGAVCRQILARRGVTIGAHVCRVGDVDDTKLNPAAVAPLLLTQLSQRTFPVLDEMAEERMRAVIEEARMGRNSVGGVIECAVTGVPAGIGGPFWGGVEPVFSSLLYGIPAVKGVEFGDGFEAARLHGSENNDPYYYENGEVRAKTNHAGGILGGITTGMPLVFRCAFKPTSSISLPQESVNLDTKENVSLEVHGRHDPCVVPRAVPVVESAAAIALLDMML